jgi:hypothetical protein
MNVTLIEWSVFVILTIHIYTGGYFLITENPGPLWSWTMVSVLISSCMVLGTAIIIHCRCREDCLLLAAVICASVFVLLTFWGLYIIILGHPFDAFFDWFLVWYNLEVIVSIFGLGECLDCICHSQNYYNPDNADDNIQYSHV